MEKQAYYNNGLFSFVCLSTLLNVFNFVIFCDEIYLHTRSFNKNVFMHLTLLLHESFVLVMWNCIRNEGAISLKKCYLMTVYGLVLESCCMTYIVLNTDKTGNVFIYNEAFVHEGTFTLLIAICVGILFYIKTNQIEIVYLDSRNNIYDEDENEDAKTKIELLTTGFNKSYEEQMQEQIIQQSYIVNN